MFEYHTNLRKVLFCVLSLAFFGLTTDSLAQGYFEWYAPRGSSNISIQGGLGSTLMIGDRDDPTLGYASPGNAFQFNGGITYRLTDFVSIRGEGTIYQLYSENKPTVWGGLPSKSVKTFGLDGYIALVHNIIPQSRIDQSQGGINAYGLIGVGQTYFVPKDGDRDNVNLREENRYQVGLDGYAKLATIIPVGFGIEYWVTNQFAIGGEIIYKITSTDFLDNLVPALEQDIRERNGQPRGADPATTANDHYYTFGVKLKYALTRGGGRGSVSGFNYKSYLKKSKRRAKYK